MSYLSEIKKMNLENLKLKKEAILKSNRKDLQKVLNLINYLIDKKSMSRKDILNKFASLIKEAGKYDHIDFKPPQSVADAAARGLEWRQKAKGKGGLSASQAKQEGVGSGVQRAVNLKNRDTLSPGTVKRMKAFFDRHEKNKTVEKGKAPYEDKGRVSWELWGGDAGRSWANKIVKQMEAADKK